MDLKIAARMTAVIAIGAGLTATLMAMSKPQGPEETPVFRSLDPGGEPETKETRAELLRCRDLGAEALKDKGCLRAWMESPRRFLKPSQSGGPAAPTADADQTVKP
ncbi:putative entry exclusion protein TrbK-alt [Sinorhizobium sp. 7-81]|uniref:putative entry exclusion protein TrbK-alt n=1 Tax=Sinorhizobium sp. 8-89 TaxID=3049089 RepID=UPI0024C2AE95|nr:putative entry exclusion protein TrbK-alt [Sinorhizobium sp. 8-89]MDK1493741.1 putative entry exclusion protein TrbK-alt [Sinorhizobium sp. 8-89]